MIRFGNFASAVETRQFDTDAAAYFAAMSVQPADARKELINDLVIGVKDAGLWLKIDWFLLLAAHDAQAGRVNVRNPAKVATAVNSPIFTVDRGFLGDNATTYIRFRCSRD